MLQHYQKLVQFAFLKHIHNIQNSQISIEKIATIGGLIAGWTIAVIALLGSGYLIIENHDIAGTV